MYLKSWVLLSATVLLGACTHLPEQSIQSTKNEVQNQFVQQRDSNLKQSVQNYTHDQSLFDVAFDDLNVDGQDDAIVLKRQEWCGSGGCTMLIFKGKSNQEFEFLSKKPLCRQSSIFNACCTEYLEKSCLFIAENMDK